MLNTSMKNFCFLNLNIPLFKDEKYVFLIPKKHIFTLNRNAFLNKELLKFFDSLNLKITFAETFFKPAGHRGTIHVDSLGGDYIKLNWIYGCGESQMCWYEIIDKKDKPVNTTSTNTLSIHYSPNEVKEIERTKIQNPTIVQVGIPHNIIDVTEDRLCISLVPIHKFTSKRVTMTESLEIFKDYLIDDQL
jgi:hypothetical protein